MPSRAGAKTGKLTAASAIPVADGTAILTEVDIFERLSDAVKQLQLNGGGAVHILGWSIAYKARAVLHSAGHRSGDMMLIEESSGKRIVSWSLLREYFGIEEEQATPTVRKSKSHPAKPANVGGSETQGSNATRGRGSNRSGGSPGASSRSSGRGPDSGTGSKGSSDKIKPSDTKGVASAAKKKCSADGGGHKDAPGAKGGGGGSSSGGGDVCGDSTARPGVGITGQSDREGSKVGGKSAGPKAQQRGGKGVYVVEHLLKRRWTGSGSREREQYRVRWEVSTVEQGMPAKK